MIQGMFKGIVTAVAIGIYIFVFEPQVIQGLTRTGIRFGAITLGIIVLILAASTFWSALRGINDGQSAPVDNPGSFGNRFAGFFIGMLQATLALSVLYWALFNFPTAS